MSNKFSLNIISYHHDHIDKQYDKIKVITPNIILSKIIQYTKFKDDSNYIQIKHIMKTIYNKYGKFKL